MACRRATGFTLLELVIALAIVAILTAMSVPTFASLVARQRLQAAVQNLRADIALARQEAGRRGQPVHLSFSPGSRWCYAIGTVVLADCQQAAAAPGNGLVKVVRGTDHPGVQLLQATPMALTSRTGGSLLGEGMARFASAEGQQLQLRLGPLGNTSVCAPAAVVAGVAACAEPTGGR